METADAFVNFWYGPVGSIVWFALSAGVTVIGGIAFLKGRYSKAAGCAGVVVGLAALPTVASVLHIVMDRATSALFGGMDGPTPEVYFDVGNVGGRLLVLGAVFAMLTLSFRREDADDAAETDDANSPT